jgi:hypothetical protein
MSSSRDWFGALDVVELENTDPTSWPGYERPPRWTPDALSYWEIKDCAGSWHSTTELLPLAIVFNYLPESEGLNSHAR